MPSEYQVHGQVQYPWTDISSALGNLRLVDNIPKPTNIPKGHALVRIRAAALNARDNMVIAHDPVYPGPHAEDLVPCADGAGEIEAVAEGSQWKVGDRVIINVNSWTDDWTYHGDKDMVQYEHAASKGSHHTHGTLREYIVLPDNELIAAPDSLSFEELAALPAAGGTAIHALLFGPRAVKPGQTVLAQGTGGVSCFVIQLASAIGATVIATSSSDAKLAEARSMGATHTINYRTNPDWSTEVLRLTNGKGVDLVVEVAGASTIEQSLKATRQAGVVALVGFLSDPKTTDLNNLIMPTILGGKTVYGVFMFNKQMTEAMVKLVTEKKVKPKIGGVFEWKDANNALIALGKQDSVGKIIIRVGSKD